MSIIGGSFEKGMYAETSVNGKARRTSGRRVFPEDRMCLVPEIRGNSENLRNPKKMVWAGRELEETGKKGAGEIE